jgi:acyl-CoA thioester hydrolase
MSHKREISRQADYPFRLEIQTRWSDNDMFGHLNNVVYQRFFEHIVVKFLTGPCGLDLMSAPVITFAAESSCRFLKPLSYGGGHPHRPYGPHQRTLWSGPVRGGQ